MSDTKSFKVGDRIRMKTWGTDPAYYYAKVVAVDPDGVRGTVEYENWKSNISGSSVCENESLRYFELVEPSPEDPVVKATAAYIATRREYLTKIDDAVKTGHKIEEMENQLRALRATYAAECKRQTEASVASNKALEALNDALARETR